MKKISIFLGFAIISLMVFTTSCSSSSTPGGALKEFSYAMEKGDADKVISMFNTNGEELSAEDKTKLEALVKQGKEEIEKKGGIKSIEILEEKISEDGNSATVNAEFTYGDGTNEPSKSKFKLIDGNWKVAF